MNKNVENETGMDDKNKIKLGLDWNIQDLTLSVLDSHITSITNMTSTRFYKHGNCVWEFRFSTGRNKMSSANYGYDLDCLHAQNVKIRCIDLKLETLNNNIILRCEHSLPHGDRIRFGRRKTDSAIP